MSPSIPALPRIGDRVIRVEAMDFAPGRVVAVSPSGRRIAVEFAEGGSVLAPAAEFLTVPESYRPPPPRRLSEVQLIELMHDGEIPPALLAAAEARDAAPAALQARRDAAAAYLAWFASHLHPLDPARFAAPLARAALAAA